MFVALLTTRLATHSACTTGVPREQQVCRFSLPLGLEQAPSFGILSLRNVFLARPRLRAQSEFTGPDAGRE